MMDLDGMGLGEMLDSIHFLLLVVVVVDGMKKKQMEILKGFGRCCGKREWRH